MKIKMFVFVLLLMPFSLSFMSVNAQETSEYYAYLELNTDGSGSVALINPMTLVVTTFASIPVNLGETIANGFLSPSGEWIALQIRSNETSAIRLFNLYTGEIVHVVDAIEFPSRPQAVTTDSDFPVFAWSPDGLYIAFHYVTEANQQGTYLYNLNTRALSDLQADNVKQYYLTWSHDSSRLALVSTICDEMACSYAAIELYNADAPLNVITIDMSSAISGNDYNQATNFCELGWNTDDSFLAFFDFCEAAALGSPREVRVVDVSDGTVIQVTHLTPDIDPAESIFTAFVETTWANTETFFIGIEKLEGSFFSLPGTRSAFTLAYNRTDQTTSVIDVRRLGQWTRASDQLFAYLAYEYVSDTDGHERLSAKVETAFFDGQTLVPLGSGPSGCSLSWNRDSRVLAYVEKNVHAVWECERFIRLNFLEGSTLRSFDVSSDAIALGWVTLKDNSPASTR